MKMDPPMKFKMKVYYCLVLALISLGVSGQAPPAGCQLCRDQYNAGIINAQEYQECIDEIPGGCPSALPLDNTDFTLVLLASGILLGFYGIQKKKKA